MEVCFYFGKKAKLARERRRIQEDCAHDWRVVSEYKIWNNYFSRDFDMCDLYCPICEAEMEKIQEVDAEKYVKIAKLRKEYESTENWT